MDFTDLSMTFNKFSESLRLSDFAVKKINCKDAETQRKTLHFSGEED